MDTPLDIHKIMTHLPHRYPFLLVDRILDIVPGKSITGLKNVTMNEPFFQGHFPEKPVMPGVLIVEAMAQTGGVLAISSVKDSSQGALMFFMGIDQVKFRKMVVPGDQLIMELSVLKQRRKIMKFAGVAKVDDTVVAEAQLMATIEL